MVPALKVALTRWLCVASIRRSPIFDVVVIDTLWPVPIAVRPVHSTCVAVYPVGATNRSLELTAAPVGVAMETLPEVCAVWIALLNDVLDAEDTSARPPLNANRSRAATVSKFVPVMVMLLPDCTVPGLKLLIVGAPAALATVKLVPLLADPAGDVTPIAPVVAPPGTVTTSSVVVAVLTVAPVPLKVTVF